MPAVATPLLTEVCPICERGMKAGRTRRLYGVVVCKKCSNGFANRRQSAWILDSIVWYFVIVLLGIPISMIVDSVCDPNPLSSDARDILDVLLGWVILPAIFCLKDRFRGCSPGRWMTGVRVVDRDSRDPIGFEQSFKRNAITIIPIVPLIIAVRLIKGPRLGDQWANTCVIWKKHAHKTPFDPRGILCIKCGYDLTGNVSGRCPECGEAILKRDPPMAAALTA